MRIMTLPFIIVMILLNLSTSYGRTIKIAVIDTGFDFNSTWTNAYKIGLTKPKICSTGSQDFTNTDLQDRRGHGTHIASLIAKGNQNIDYCIIVLKYYDPQHPNDSNLLNSNKAFEYAINQNVDIINYSGGGTEYDKKENELINKAITKGIRIITAAGNESIPLFYSEIGKINIVKKSKNRKINDNKKPRLCNYYPACHNIKVERIGNIYENGDIVPSSDFGDAVTSYKMGYDVLGLCPGNTYCRMTGTSQSSAIRSGEIVKELDKINKLYDQDQVK